MTLIHTDRHCSLFGFGVLSRGHSRYEYLRCPFALSADPSFAALAMPLPLRRVKVLRLLSLSRANEIRHGLTQLAKTGWLDTRYLIPSSADKPRYLVGTAKQLVFWFCLSDFGGKMDLKLLMQTGRCGFCIVMEIGNGAPRFKAWKRTFCTFAKL